MSKETQDVTQGVAPPLDRPEFFSDGKNKVVSIELPIEDFLAKEDQSMNALVALYMEHFDGGVVPRTDAISPERIFSTGMMSRTHCLRIGDTVEDVRYTVWAEGANFDGYRSLQNATMGDLTAFKPYGLMFEAVKHQLAETIRKRQPTFYEIKGLVNDHYYYFTKAVLPLGDEEGKIVKCLVPFTNKVADVPLDLREEFFSADVY